MRSILSGLRKAEGRRQKAEGRRQKAEGRRQKAEGKERCCVFEFTSSFCLHPYFSGHDVNGRLGRALPSMQNALGLAMRNERGAPELVTRTRAFALDVIRFYSQLPRETAAQVLGKQLLRSGTSVGAQYREGQRAKSIADFISKAEGALQELEETAYWLELIDESGINNSGAVKDLRSETDQLVSIFVSIVRAAKETRASK